MTLQVINNGSRVNDETAETLFSAFEKVKSNFSELYGIYGSEVEAFTFTTKQNDLALAAGTRIVRWNGAGSTGITGIAAPSTARVLTIVNASTDYLLWMENENTASAAANRLMLPDGFPAFLMPGDTITLVYDLTTARWRVLEWPTRGPAMGLNDFDDGMGKASQRLYTRIGGTGAAVDITGAAVDSAYKGAGVFACATGTTSTGYAMVGGYATGLVPALGSALYVSRSRLGNAPSAAETFVTFHGLVNFHATYSNGIFWEAYWDGSAYKLSRTVMVDGVATRSETGYQTAGGTMKWLIVFVNPGWTRADFIHSSDSVSFVLADSISSGLPSGTRYVQFQTGIVKSNGGTSRTIDIDLVGYRLSQARA